jgi:hypothetical protein
MEAAAAAVVEAIRQGAPGEYLDLPNGGVHIADPVQLDGMTMATAAVTAFLLAAATPSEHGEVGWSRVAAERYRQIEKGRTAEHDDTHGRGELIMAALAYTFAGLDMATDAADWYPLAWGEFTAKEKPEDNLTIGAALLCAEIDRRDRARA